MPPGSASRVTGRNFAVREYAQWLNAMSAREYNALRSRYNARGARRNTESFEDSLRNFDTELEEYLQMNCAAGFRSVPRPTLINNMLSMWLERDISGEPAPGVTDEWRTDSERAGFRPMGSQPSGNHHGGFHSGQRGGQRQRSPFDDVSDDVSDDDDFDPVRRRRRDSPSREPRNPYMAGRGDGPGNSYGTHRSQQQPSRGDFGPRRRGGGAGNSHETDRSQQRPSRGDHGPRRRGGAPPVREPRDRGHAHGSSRRSAQPPRGQRLRSAGAYSGEESEEESEYDF